jgi:hypothetical protein
MPTLVRLLSSSTLWANILLQLGSAFARRHGIDVPASAAALAGVAYGAKEAGAYLGGARATHGVPTARRARPDASERPSS